jgi:hypothetical protein
VSRPSTAASSIYGGNVYDAAPEPTEKPAVEEEPDEEDEEEARARDARKRICNEEIWRDMLISSNGRDKALVCLIYDSTSLSLSDETLPW